MAPDDLNAPLGQDKRKPPRRIGAPQVLAALLALSGALVAAWAALVNDPLGGEPVVVVSAKPPPADTGARRHDGPTNGPQARAAVPPPAGSAAPGANTVTIIDGSSGKRQEVVVPAKPGRQSSLAPANPGLLETTGAGAIPKIGPDGATAFAAYAEPRTLTAAQKDLPRIAIVIAGMGISASGTADAFALPASVAFAVAPSAADVERLAERARTEGHEVLLQVPMEPYDYPDNDPGPQTLLTSLPAEQNLERLHWLMARFRGYIGIAGAMGARFVASEQALRPVLTDAAQRGLMYFDDGASSRSTARQIALAQNMPFARADVSIAAGAGPQEVERALARLELAARETGAAVGIADAQSAAIGRIAAWATSVEGRGFVLVPVSMVALGTRPLRRAASADSR